MSLLLAVEPAEVVREFAPHALFILGVVFITAFLVMRIRKRGERNAAQPTAREHLQRYKTRDAVRGDLEGLMVDIEELARRLGTQLDAKSRQLEMLMDEADQRIAQLGGAATTPRAKADRYEPQAPPAGDPAPPLPTPEPAVSKPAEPAPAAAEGDPLVAEVHRLADTGRSAAGIAAELGEHVGKVELILALRQA